MYPCALHRACRQHIGPGMQQDLSNACRLLPCTQMLLPTGNPHCFPRIPFISPPSPLHICSLEWRPYNLCLFYSYPLSKGQPKSRLLHEALYDSPERHGQPLSEMPWWFLLSQGIWHSLPLFEDFSCLSLLRFELLEGKDLFYSSFQDPHTVSSSGCTN